MRRFARRSPSPTPSRARRLVIEHLESRESPTDVLGALPASALGSGLVLFDPALTSNRLPSDRHVFSVDADWAISDHPESAAPPVFASLEFGYSTSSADNQDYRSPSAEPVSFEQTWDTLALDLFADPLGGQQKPATASAFPHAPQLDSLDGGGGNSGDGGGIIHIGDSGATGGGGSAGELNGTNSGDGGGPNDIVQRTSSQEVHGLHPGAGASTAGPTSPANSEGGTSSASAPDHIKFFRIGRDSRSLDPAGPARTEDAASTDNDPGTPVFSTSASAPAAAPRRPARRLLDQTFGKMPLRFERNQGQSPSAVRFQAHGKGYHLMLTATDAVLALGRPIRAIGAPPTVPATHVLLRLQLVGSDPSAKAVGLEQLPSTSNYYRGRDPRQWQIGIPNFAKVRYENVYPGIDLVYYGTSQRQVEFDFVVTPRGNAGQIRLAIQGATGTRLDAQGHLVLSTLVGDVIQRAPTLYQRGPTGARQLVAGRYIMRSPTEIGFEVVGTYDRSRPLYIDPILDYTQIINDGAEAIASDAVGNVFVTGGTPGDVYVTKIHADGTIAYTSYLGGDEQEAQETGLAIALDEGGNPVITGRTTAVIESTNPPIKAFPTTPGALQSAATPGRGTSDAFVSKLGGGGGELIYSSLLGGNGDEYGRAIAVDNSGRIYVTGETNSSLADNFPISQFPLQGTPSPAVGDKDSFIVKINPVTTLPTNQQLEYGSFYQGNGDDLGYGIAVDATGKIYLAGQTSSTNLLLSSTPFQSAKSGPTDAFLVKLDPAAPVASQLLYASYLGGSGNDTGQAIAVDEKNQIYLGGWTASGNFPIPAAPTAKSYARFLNGPTDAFLVKLNPAAVQAQQQVTYGTYLGGGGDERVFSLVIDRAGTAYVSGKTTGAFPNLNPLPETAGVSLPNYVARLNTELDGEPSLEYSTILRAALSPPPIPEREGRAIALDALGNFYVTGVTGTGDSFVSKITEKPTRPVITQLEGTPVGTITDGQVVKLNTTPQALTIRGTADPGNRITITRHGVGVITPFEYTLGGLLSTVIADGNGNWEFGCTTTWYDGTHAFSATSASYDPLSFAVRWSEPSKLFQFANDRTAPSVTLYPPTSGTRDRTPEVRIAALDDNDLPDQTKVAIDVDLDNNGVFSGVWEVGYTLSTWDPNLLRLYPTLYRGVGRIDIAPSPLPPDAPPGTPPRPVLSPGTYRVRARVWDAVDNEGTSSSTPEQTITIANATDWVIVSARVPTWDPIDGLPELQTGNVQIKHPLDIDQSPGTSVGRDAHLIYNADSYYLRPVVQATFATPNLGTLPAGVSASVELIWNGQSQGQVPFNFTNGATQDPPAYGESFTVAVQAPSITSTGRYSWTLNINIPGVPQMTASGTTFGVTTSGSEFGRGWTFSLADRIHEIKTDASQPVPDGLLRAFGTGGWRYYAKVDDTTFRAPEDAGVINIVSEPPFRYVYRNPEGEEHKFDYGGRTKLLVSADGYEPFFFYYDPSDRLMRVIAPDGGTTTLTYQSAPLGPRVVVNLPGNRDSLIEIGSAVADYAITDYISESGTDPLFHVRLFRQGSWGIVREDRGYFQQHWDYYGYSFFAGGWVTEITLGDRYEESVVYGVSPAAVHGSGFYVAAGEPWAYSAAYDRAWFKLDDRGRPLLRWADDGGLWTYKRNATNARIEAVTDPLGRTTTYTRDSATGFVTVERVPDNSLRTFQYSTYSAGGVTRHRVTKFINERNIETDYTYNGNGQRLTESTAGQQTVYTYTSAEPLGLLYPSGERTLRGLVGCSAKRRALPWRDRSGAIRRRNGIGGGC